MEQKLIDEYSKKFDEYCISQKRKSTISQEHKAITWRMVFILAKAIWGYDEPNHTNLSEVFKELKFPYNENGFKNFIENSYEYYIFEDERDEINNDLMLEYSDYITLVETKENIAWFKNYCKERNLNCSLDDSKIAFIIEEFLSEIKEYGLSKRKEYELLDKIFKRITFPDNQENYQKFIKEADSEEIFDKLDEL